MNSSGSSGSGIPADGGAELPLAPLLLAALGPTHLQRPSGDAVHCRWLIASRGRWGATTFFYYVAGLVSALELGGPRWTAGPALTTILANKKADRRFQRFDDS
jgi:hypothetical protein